MLLLRHQMLHIGRTDKPLLLLLDLLLHHLTLWLLLLHVLRRQQIDYS